MVNWRTDGGEHTGEPDLVVAADGIRRTVRAWLFPEIRLRYSGNSCRRAVITDTDRFGDRLVEMSGWAPNSVRYGSVCDAAHAFLPTMGQGANTALEDGVCVGRVVAEQAQFASASHPSIPLIG